MQVGLDEEVNYHPTLSFTSMEDIETGGITTAVQDPSGSRGSMRPTEYGASVAALSNSSASHSAPGFVPTDGVIDPAGAPQPGHSSTADATAESPPTYNPLTHYMTGTFFILRDNLQLTPRWYALDFADTMRRHVLFRGSGLGECFGCNGFV
jgi:hypothetical protein